MEAEAEAVKEVATEEVEVAMEEVTEEEVTEEEVEHTRKAASRSTPRGPPLCNISCLCRQRRSPTLLSPRHPRTYYYPHIQSSSNFRT